MKRAVCISYLITQLITVSLLLFAAGSTDYYIKREQLFPNFIYLGAGLVLSLILLLILRNRRPVLDIWVRKNERILTAVTIAGFFILSSIFCISGFFYSDWDPAAILGAVFDLLKGRNDEIAVTYFSNHPNNLLLVSIYLSVMELAGVFGADSVLCLVVFQCFVTSAAAFLFYNILKKIFEGSAFIPYAGLLLFELWIGLSPWFIITYSDEIGIIFPLVILLAYQEAEDRVETGMGRRVFLWGLIGAAAAFGYYIKPQTAIAFLAAVITAFIFGFQRREKKRAACILCGVAAAAACTMLIQSYIIPSLGIETEEDRSFGAAHYFMMGLNPETNGVYSEEDTQYTDSFETPDEKREADILKARERLKGYGFPGLMNHLKKKILVICNDGLFAWGVDGNFFAGRESEDTGTVPGNSLTPLIWSFIMPDGKDHGKYSSAAQLIWVMLLFGGCVFGLLVLDGTFGRKRAEGFLKETHYVVMLSLTGLFLFELLFEARARYLFSYTPYYLLSGFIPAGAFLMKGKMNLWA